MKSQSYSKNKREEDKSKAKGDRGHTEDYRSNTWIVNQVRLKAQLQIQGQLIYMGAATLTK